jgi:hypothetical protein
LQPSISAASGLAAAEVIRSCDPPPPVAFRQVDPTGVSDALSSESFPGISTEKRKKRHNLTALHWVDFVPEGTE